MSTKKEKTVLALGADMKNRFLIAKGDNFSFGPEIGDLSDAGNFNKFRNEVQKAVEKVRPDVIAYDPHPNYFSTKFITTYDIRHTTCELFPVEHHHAHIASVIQEYGLKKPVIGVSFDGTGFGADGNMWGGEFLLVDRKGFKRLAHFKYIKMPGGDKVIREPWRMVISILGKRAFPYVKIVKRKDKEAIIEMMKRNINSPLTSSAGRLFDAASALLGICQEASYEAEGPIKLEKMCEGDVKEGYRASFLKEGAQYIIDAKPIFLNIIKDLKRGIKRSVIATKFHNSMSDVIFDTAKRISKNTRIKDVALSGGVFQNKFLKTKVIKKLSLSGFNCFINKKTPVNDFNISLGQYYVSSGSRKN